MIAKGGKSIYGASVGIMMLEAQFPRILGDMGNALSWPFPVLYRVVRDASPDRVVRRKAEGLYEAFLQTGRDLISDGADGITTNCGFLVLFQSDLQRDLGVPVITSSLIQLPMVERMLPPAKRAGILTISSATLLPEHLAAAGCRPDTPIGGTPENGEFYQAILGNRLTLEVEKSREENVSAAQKLVAEHPEIGALVLECTNMVPYASAISKATDLPVFSIYNLVQWFQQGLQPREKFA